MLGSAILMKTPCSWGGDFTVLTRNISGLGRLRQAQVRNFFLQTGRGNTIFVHGWMGRAEKKLVMPTGRAALGFHERYRADSGLKTGIEKNTLEKKRVIRMVC